MSDYPHVIPRPAEAGEGSYVSLEDDWSKQEHRPSCAWNSSVRFVRCLALERVGMTSHLGANYRASEVALPLDSGARAIYDVCFRKWQCWGKLVFLRCEASQPFF